VKVDLVVLVGLWLALAVMLAYTLLRIAQA